MTARLVAVALDCTDMDAQTAFWTAALDAPVSRRWSDAHDGRYVEIALPGGVLLLLQAVGDAPPEGKNRLHLDLRPHDGAGQHEEVDRLTGLGAVPVSDDPSLPWVVLTDPEGNEFCVLPPD